MSDYVEKFGEFTAGQPRRRTERAGEVGAVGDGVQPAELLVPPTNIRFRAEASMVDNSASAGPTRSGTGKSAATSLLQSITTRL